jgi:hypothetical protein
MEHYQPYNVPFVAIALNHKTFVLSIIFRIKNVT